MSESLKVMKLRWIESVQKTYDAFDKAGLYSAMDVKHLDVKHKFDEVVLVHNEMIKQICDVVDELEAGQIQSLQTLQYITNITNRMKEE
jgi:hypothetical protein